MSFDGNNDGPSGSAGGTITPFSLLSDIAVSKAGQADDNKGPLTFIPGSQFADSYVPDDQLIHGYFPRNRLFTLTGPTGSGKTNVALYLARCVAQGQQFADSPFPAGIGNTLFLAGENPADVQGRAKALFHNWSFTQEEKDRITFVEKPFSIQQHVDEIRRWSQSGVKLDLIVVDTLMAFFPGDDDNSNAQMKEFAQELRLLLEGTGNPLVLVPSHPTLSATKEDMRPRGGGAFLAEIDGNACLWPSADKTMQLYPHPFKFRGTPFPPVSLKTTVLDNVPGTQDSRGCWPTIPVAEPATKKDIAIKIEMEVDDMDKILLLLEDDKHTPRKELKANSGLAPSTFDRRLAELRSAKLIEVARRGQYSLTKKGRDWVDAYYKAQEGTDPFGLAATGGGE